MIKKVIAGLILWNMVAGLITLCLIGYTHNEVTVDNFWEHFLIVDGTLFFGAIIASVVTYLINVILED